MKFSHITLIAALLTSCVAIYFSVLGLAAIFAASVVSIIIMGSMLEIDKLITAVWLHKNWHIAPTWLKTYLSISVVVLMLITSMGIFGFLSKSHVEQTAQSQENIAQIDRIESKIAHHKSIIERAEEKIKEYEQNGSTENVAINAQIDKEQGRIDSAYKRSKILIEVQKDIIATEHKKKESRIKLYHHEINQINKNLKAVEDALRHKDIITVQRLIGTDDDGVYGKDTINSLQLYRTKNEKRRKWLLQKVDNIESNPSQATINAQAEIKRINQSVSKEIKQSQEIVTKLSMQLRNQDNNALEKLIDIEQQKIKTSNNTLDTLINKKYELQSKYRKLEAEFGPIKDIAALVYGNDPSQNVLESAVRWVIIMLIFVFDPLAVILLIAAQYSFNKEHNEKKNIKYSDRSNEDPYQAYLSEITNIKEEITQPKNDEIEDFNIGDEISLTKVNDDYISLNNKLYRIPSLIQKFPEFKLNFGREVRSGDIFPKDPIMGMMFILTSEIPTSLYIFNGKFWNKIDKNVLEYSAYSHEYIKKLIKLIENGEYNRSLLNVHEKSHIEKIIKR